MRRPQSNGRTRRGGALLPLALGLLAAAGSAESEPTEPIQPPRNVLLVVLDDVSVYDLKAYSLGSSYPKTPRINALATEGVVFRNCWSNPVCSATRATILTGRHSFRTGIGGALSGAAGAPALSPSELTIPELLPPAYASALIGKWHLGMTSAGLLAPNEAGFDHFAGVWGNMTGTMTYFQHNKVTDGVKTPSQTYLTTEQVDDAIDWISRVETPWFCQLSLSAAHEPFHCPPAELHDELCAEFMVSLTRTRFEAMIQAVDTELGRLLDTLAPDVLAHTTILVVGDNGTPAEVVAQPLKPGKAKLSMYQGGIHVPLIVWGAGVSDTGGKCTAPVGVVDLLATVLELAGASPAPSAIDSVSLAPYLRDAGRRPLRTHNFAEMFTPSGLPPGQPGGYYRYAIRDERYKLHRIAGNERLFDLFTDPLENVDLAADPQYAGELDALRAELFALLGSPSLAPEPASVSLQSGGAQSLSLATGAGLQGLPYLVLGSASGTAPGTPIDSVVLPLNADAYLTHTLLSADGPAHAGTVGMLDADGTASATLTFAAGLDPQLAGQVLHHAALVFGPAGDAVLATEAAQLALLP